MEQTILPILIMINRQGRKSKTAANLNLSNYRKNKHQLRISFFKDKKKERERKKKLKVMPLPQWPTPAGRVQWDVPWLHSDTFIITKNNNSSETKKNMTHKGRQKG